ncbi:MAG: universal stress protein, partial [Acidobacteriota bacterium]
MDNLRELSDVSSDTGLRLGTYKAKFRKILAGVDYSETGVAVLKAAKSLAEQFGGTLLLAHAVAPVLYGPGATPELLQADLNAAAAQMDVLISKAELGSISHRSLIEFAEPTDLIDRIARAQTVDLVIVGTH